MEKYVTCSLELEYLPFFFFCHLPPIEIERKTTSFLSNFWKQYHGPIYILPMFGGPGLEEWFKGEVSMLWLSPRFSLNNMFLSHYSFNENIFFLLQMSITKSLITV